MLSASEYSIVLIVIIILVVFGIFTFFVGSSLHERRESFTDKGFDPIVENLRKVVNLKSQKKKFLQSVQKLNKEILSLREYYENVGNEK